MKAFVRCVGCEQRLLDAQRVRDFLLRNGATLVEHPGSADLLVLVTCAVDRRNEDASANELLSLDRIRKPESRLVVGGCLPSISPARLSGFPVSATFSPRSLDSLDALMPGGVTVPMRLVADPSRPRPSHRSHPSQARPSTPRQEYDAAKAGFTIRINHGCALRCSYCVIRRATGHLESVPESVILQAFRNAVARREQTILLAGGDTGAWGRDSGSSFSHLLRWLLAEEGEHRMFIHDFNASWLVRDIRALEGVLEERSANLRAMCIPVQSGSDAVLGRMRRPYKAEAVCRALGVLRRCAPQIALGTHVMVGFPGESEADFERTLTLLRSCRFDFVTCFQYSEHPSADSAALLPKVPAAVAQARLDCLRALLGAQASFIL